MPRVIDDTPERFVERVGGEPQHVADRVDDLQFIGETLRGRDFADRLARPDCQVTKLRGVEVGQSLLGGTEDDDDVVADRDDRDRAAVVGAEDMPGDGPVVPGDDPRVERIGDHRLGFEADLDDPGPTGASADAADMREALLLDPTEEEEICCSGGGRNLLHRRSRRREGNARSFHTGHAVTIGSPCRTLRPPSRKKPLRATSREVSGGVTDRRVAGALPPAAIEAATNCEHWTVNANLAGVLHEADDRNAERPALHSEGRSVSYAELRRGSAAYAGELRRRGVRAGDRVAIRLPNSPAFVASYFAVLELGAIVVPLNTLLAEPEVEQRLALARSSLLLDDPEEIDAACAAPLEGTSPGGPTLARCASADPAVLLFTSGTTGQPKAAILTHAGLRNAAENAAAALGLRHDDVVLGAAPFSHVLGQSSALLAAFLTGASVAVASRFDQARALELMVATGTTVLLGVPTMCIALCEAADSATRLPPLRLAHIGGAPLAPEAISQFERLFAGASIYDGYGLTELSGIATTTIVGEPRRPGSVGVALGQTELRIVSPQGTSRPAGEVGEIQFRGPSVTPGYSRKTRRRRALR